MVNYYLTKFLTDYVEYRSYLYRFGHNHSPRCPEYPEEEENAEHVTFKCPRFTSQRNRLGSLVGESVNVGNIIKVMLKAEEN